MKLSCFLSRSNGHSLQTDTQTDRQTEVKKGDSSFHYVCMYYSYASFSAYLEVIRRFSAIFPALSVVNAVGNKYRMRRRRSSLRSHFRSKKQNENSRSHLSHIRSGEGGRWTPIEFYTATLRQVLRLRRKKNSILSPRSIFLCFPLPRNHFKVPSPRFVVSPAAIYCTVQCLLHAHTHRRYRL